MVNDDRGVFRSGETSYLPKGGKIKPDFNSGTGRVLKKGTEPSGIRKDRNANCDDQNGIGGVAVKTLDDFFPGLKDRKIIGSEEPVPSGKNPDDKQGPPEPILAGR